LACFLVLGVRETLDKVTVKRIGIVKGGSTKGGRGPPREIPKKKGIPGRKDAEGALCPPWKSLNRMIVKKKSPDSKGFFRGEGGCCSGSLPLED
jgi:hypothetical protein